MKKLMMVALLSPAIALADTVVINGSPSVVRRAEMREAIRQNTVWTSENIAKTRICSCRTRLRTATG